MKKGIAVVCLGAIVAMGQAVVTAQEEEAREAPQTQVYIIKEGDTLWDISSQVLNSPWYWPRLWHANPRILNPHLIYPGNELQLPGAASAGDSAAAPVAQAPVPATEPSAEVPSEAPVEELAAAEPAYDEEVPSLEPEPVPDVAGMEMMSVEQQLPPMPTESRLRTAIIRRDTERRFYLRYGSEGFVSKDEVKAAASIVDSHVEKMLFTQNDKIFIGLGEGSGVQPGQRFTAYETLEKVNHPSSGAFVGYRTKQVGTIEVLEVYPDVSKAVIVQAFDAMERGTLLKPFEPYERTVYPQPSPESLDGFIIAVQNDLIYAAEHMIVYVDKGANSNLNVGNVFEFYRPHAPALDKLTGKKVSIPSRALGAGIVVDTQPNTATVLVWDTIDALTVGDRIRPLLR